MRARTEEEEAAGGREETETDRGARAGARGYYCIYRTAKGAPNELQQLSDGGGSRTHGGKEGGLTW